LKQQTRFAPQVRESWLPMSPQAQWRRNSRVSISRTILKTEESTETCSSLPQASNSSSPVSSSTKKPPSNSTEMDKITPTMLSPWESFPESRSIRDSAFWTTERNRTSPRAWRCYLPWLQSSMPSDADSPSGGLC